MALFKKLFSKETCCVCGKEVGALKRKRLADGVICKDCAKGLSEWFTDYEGSTVEQVLHQLKMREANQAMLGTEMFQTTAAYGDYGVILVSQPTGLFCALSYPSDAGLLGAKRAVTDVSQVIDLNPDAVQLQAVRDVQIEIEEHRDEVTYEEDDREVSYSPRHWEYEYQFKLVIEVEHPYLKTMKVRLNERSVRIENVGERASAPVLYGVPDTLGVGQRAADLVLGDSLGVRTASEVWTDAHLAEEARQHPTRSWNVAEMPEQRYGFRCTQENWREIQRYDYYTKMALEAAAALLSAQRRPVS